MCECECVSVFRCPPPCPLRLGPVRTASLRHRRVHLRSCGLGAGVRRSCREVRQVPWAHQKGPFPSVGVECGVSAGPWGQVLRHDGPGGAIQQAGHAGPCVGEGARQSGGRQPLSAGTHGPNGNRLVGGKWVPSSCSHIQPPTAQERSFLATFFLGLCKNWSEPSIFAKSNFFLENVQKRRRFLTTFCTSFKIKQ